MNLASRLFGEGMQTGNPLSNMSDMMAKLEEFKKQYQGQDPNKLINDLVSSGKCTKEQVEQARSFAQSLGIR